MGTFSYKAIDQDGVLKSGTADADTIETAYSDLAARGLNVLDVAKAGRLATGIARGFSSWKVKRSEIAEFAANLSVIMKAGVPILDALGDISHTLDNKYLMRVVDDIRERIQSGTSFSNALAQHPGVFPDIFIRLATIGEETGRLEGSIAEVAEHLQKMEDLAGMVKRALIYPIFALVVTGGALAFWIIYVLPKIMVIIKDMGIPLSFITKLLFTASNLMQSYWYVVLAVPVAIFIILKALKQKEGTRFYVDFLKIKLPIVKQFVYNKLLAMFSEQLRILVVAGITIDRSLVIVGNAIGSEVFKRVLLKVRDQIMTGSRISDSMRQQSIFPPLVTRMVDIGETSGNLDSQFGFLSNYYYKRLSDISEKLGKMIEPLLIAVVGVIFAVIIIGLLLPIYDVVVKFDKG
ncbi:MAG: type II secretion system F family protein [Syntrophorhabdaceae bacterium]|nr:type II secretion system F family protein [Syntrophorhabdaceae bacterium]